MSFECLEITDKWEYIFFKTTHDMNWYYWLCMCPVQHILTIIQLSCVWLCCMATYIIDCILWPQFFKRNTSLYHWSDFVTYILDRSSFRVVIHMDRYVIFLYFTCKYGIMYLNWSTIDSSLPTLAWLRQSFGMLWHVHDILISTLKCPISEVYMFLFYYNTTVVVIYWAILKNIYLNILFAMSELLHTLILFHHRYVELNGHIYVSVNWVILVQYKACHLFGTKTLCESMWSCCHWDILFKPQWFCRVLNFSPKIILVMGPYINRE